MRLHGICTPVPSAKASDAPDRLLAAFDGTADSPAIVLTHDDETLAGVATRAAVAQAIAAKACRIDAYVERDVLLLDGMDAIAQLVDLPRAGIQARGAWIVARAPDGRWGVIAPLRLAQALAAHAQRLAAERNSARRALAQARRTQVMFLAHIGHELKTPLNAVLGYADLLQARAQNVPDTEALHAPILAMREGGLHMLDIVDNMLDLARMDAQAMALQEEELALDSLAQSAIAMLAPLADMRGVRLQLKAKAPLPLVLADARIMRQVLLNLLSNAIKFSATGDRVLVLIETGARGALRLSVKDQGPGIPADQIEKVMQPFHQADRNPNRRAAGSGLGLPLVKAFIELHDGRFQLLSTEGRGTRAIVTLPPGRVLDRAPGRQQAFAFQRRAPA
ncbi:MAG: sensor histidine kinase [Alphaproteobacteria bacterium]|nr:MAG: sensor histidine kinase [Alphaproteobacteria bacterium]